MSFVQLLFKQMRQRSLSTFLTVLSVMLGVTLAVVILVVNREADKLLVQSDFGYDMLVGPKGSELTLVMNTIYGIGQAQGTIPYSVFEDLSVRQRQFVRWAVPFALGDSYKGFRIIATTPMFFGVDDKGQALPEGRGFEYRLDRRLTLSQGKAFHPRKFEAVIGSEVAAKNAAKMGDEIWLEHGGNADDVHKERWKVVGILAPTGTAIDRACFIPLITSYAIPEHESFLEAAAKLAGSGTQTPQPKPQASTTVQADEIGNEIGNEIDDDIDLDAMSPYTIRPNGEIALRTPKSKWRVSGVFVRSRGGYQFGMLSFGIRNTPTAMAASPAGVMREFFNTFLKNSAYALLGLAILVSIVAAVSILVSIYNSVAARRREIAILRALGATRLRILSLITTEAILIGLVGGMLGLIAGHVVAAAAAYVMRNQLGETIGVFRVGWVEIAYIAGVVLVAALAGLIPALKAYQVSVAENLVEG